MQFLDFSFKIAKGMPQDADLFVLLVVVAFNLFGQVGNRRVKHLKAVFELLLGGHGLLDTLYLFTQVANLLTDGFLSRFYLGVECLKPPLN